MTEWISCKEKTPPNDVDIFVWVKHENGIRSGHVTIACIHADYNYWWDYMAHQRRPLYKILAWLPMPKPFEEENDE